ncbi:suppressor of fused domain protein [Hymenobacter endophyticus]|uniref:Suppressor of fused domain protein n=1 Tax=Hymenobacter endophyticus TaxID=3076335 RepID=A0ABU3TEG5_9BACT|nr:suppressor of fused domain protein [Hymenobacter endophyticus]MDU0369738.1 suppressor of fused domain protein [Hymenobacter endophyticus]
MYDLTELQQHLQNHWQMEAKQMLWQSGPTGKLDAAFRVLEFPPGPVHAMWIYSTLGMSLNRPENPVELHIFSDKQNATLVELLTAVASYHRNGLPLDLHHTVNFGRLWQDNSAASFGFVSLPYLDGEGLEVFEWKDEQLHNLWLIPITEEERDYKISNGWDALEDVFEAAQLQYTNPYRASCV